jgi:regulatory protein
MFSPAANIPYDLALLKASNYCAYQERYQSQVKAKLLEWNTDNADIDKILLYLIENNYLNEGRFAQVYVSGKVRMKHWGFQKIKFELKKKGLTETTIKLAIQAFDEKEYIAVLKNEIEKQIVKQALLAKGFSSDDISTVQKTLL